MVITKRRFMVKCGTRWMEKHEDFFLCHQTIYLQA